MDFEITMDAFLVPLPATTSASAPENKQFYFLYFYTLCWHAITKIRNTTCKRQFFAEYVKEFAELPLVGRKQIEKIEKNPEFSSKIGVRNTSEFISSKQSKK